MKQCRKCGNRDLDPRDITYVFDQPEFDGSMWELETVVHSVITEDHWPHCEDGLHCASYGCPIEVEELCGPVVDLGHGGNLQAHDAR